jgi:hypothetical protein
MSQESCCEHESGCAVHNEPALPKGECDCKKRVLTLEEFAAQHPEGQWGSPYAGEGGFIDLTDPED